MVDGAAKEASRFATCTVLSWSPAAVLSASRSPVAIDQTAVSERGATPAAPHTSRPSLDPPNSGGGVEPCACVSCATGVCESMNDIAHAEHADMGTLLPSIGPW